jgi:signal transduction histidine kinase
MDFNLTSVGLPALLSDIVGSQQGHAQTKNLSLALIESDVPPAVFADPVRLRQILLNLTNNALKFTEQGGVTVRAVSQGDRVRIEVQDTGVGIKPEDQQLIFEKFRQSESFVTRSHQGTGLGLTLAKELVEHMGGEIGMSSAPNVGSIFYVLLPVIDKSQI